MMSKTIEDFPALHSALTRIEADHQESLGALAAAIDRDTAMDSMVDGLVGAVLESLATAALVGTTVGMATGDRQVADYGKIRLARQKLIEGLVEMVEASNAEDLINENVVGADADLSGIQVLREYVAYVKSINAGE